MVDTENKPHTIEVINNFKEGLVYALVYDASERIVYKTREYGNCNDGRDMARDDAQEWIDKEVNS